MTAKEYLQQIGDLSISIRNLHGASRQLRSQAMGNQSPRIGERVQGGSGRTMADAVDRYVDIERRLDSIADEYGATIERITRQINELPDARHRQLLHLRYVEGKRLEDIACIMRKRNGSMYSYIHIKRLHGYALAEFSKKFLQ